MLDFLGYEDYGKKVVDAIEEHMVEGKILTPDMGGTAMTAEVGDNIVVRLRK